MHIVKIAAGVFLPCAAQDETKNKNNYTKKISVKSISKICEN
jgi:hypothetical protein